MDAKNTGQAWVVSVDMGYGHQRAASPLTFLSPNKKIVSANDYEGMPESDKAVWDKMKAIYYFVSRMKSRGTFGRFLFNIYDRLQKIDEYYLVGRYSAPTFEIKKLYDEIRGGWGKHLVEKLAENPLPLITPYFIVAFMAEHWNYPGPIYAIVTDSDISRGWAPLEPAKTRIMYCAPTDRVVERLKKYGIPAKNIILTGFPLPRELVGTQSDIAKHDLRQRLGHLDPSGDYTKQYAPLIESYLETELFDKASQRPPSIAFVVGGAGAQVEIGTAIMKNLAPLIAERKIILHLVAGSSAEANTLFHARAKENGLEKYIGSGLTILYETTKEDYFRSFNELLHDVDILWTKPSELSFYGALGIPIIIAPPIGAQEIQNRKWLLFTGAGIDALPMRFVAEWLPDFIREGRLAEAAMQGLIKMERNGTEHIAKLVTQNSPR